MYVHRDTGKYLHYEEVVAKNYAKRERVCQLPLSCDIRQSAFVVRIYLVLRGGLFYSGDLEFDCEPF